MKTKEAAVKKMLETNGAMFPNNDTIHRFSTVKDAKRMLKFLSIDSITGISKDGSNVDNSFFQFKELLTNSEDVKNFIKSNRNVGTGVIKDDVHERMSVVEYYTGKKEYAISMFDIFSDAEECAKSAFVIASNVKATVKLSPNEGHELNPEFVRMCFVKYDPSTQKAETFSHIDPRTNVITFIDKNGDKHYLAEVGLVTGSDKPKLSTPEAEIDVTFDINETKGIISYYTEALNPLYRYLAVPLFWDKAFKESTYKECEETWNRAFRATFLKYCVEHPDPAVFKYTPEAKELIKDRIGSNIDNNKKFALSKAVYSVIHEENNYISNAIDSIGKFDEFTVYSQLYPRYGNETIDSGNYRLDPESGLPVLGPKDIINLGIVGIDKGLIAATIEGTQKAVVKAKENIKYHTEQLLTPAKRGEYSKRISDIINDDERFSAEDLYKQYDDAAFTHLFTEDFHMFTIEDTKKFIEDAYQQMAEFKLMSIRMEEKIKSGEFANRSSQAYYELILQVFKKNENIDVKNDGFYISFLEACNAIAKDRIDNDCKRISDGIKSTLFYNEDNANPFILSNLLKERAYSLIDFASIDSDDATVKITKAVDAIESKLSFMELLSYMPFKIVDKLYPKSVFSPSTGNEPSEAMLELSKNLFDSGFACLNEDPEYSEQIASKLTTFAQKLEASRERVISNYDKYLNEYKLSLDEINASIASIELAIGIINASDLLHKGNKLYLNDTSNSEVKKIRLKTDADKNRALTKREILTQIKCHLTNIVTGRESCRPIDIEMKDLNEKDHLIYKIDKNGAPATISIEDFGKLDENERNGSCVILRRLTKDEIVNYMLDTEIAFSTYIVFLICLEKISSEFVDLAATKTGMSRNKDYQDFERKCFAILSLLIPGLSVLEGADIRKAADENGKLDLSEIVTNDMKVNFGPNVVDESISVFSDVKSLARLRCKFVNESLTFMNNCFEFLISNN